MTEHRPAELHRHTHGPGCGHEAVLHADHMDHLHDGHVHREHGTNGAVHYDECASRSCADCTCSTCNHAA